MQSKSLAVAALLFAVVATIAQALPFGPKSGVTELTPATLPGFLNTHKPVFIVFYAPWCGHCKAIHPEWEKFAKGVKDVVRVGAINADEHREIAGQFGIKGFPTIKYWKMGSKKGMTPMDYQQARTAAALQSAAVAEIHAKGVTSVADEAALKAALGKSSTHKGIVLFTEKKKSPPIFSVLSQSPHFSSKIAFAMVSSSAKALVQKFSVTKFPSLFVVSESPEGDDGFVMEPYEGAIDYTSIAKHLQSVLGVDTSESGKAKGGKSGDASSKPKSGEKQAAEPEPEAAKSTGPKPSLPVRPVQFSESLFPSFCGPAALKLKSQQPICVISLGASLSLSDLHEKFSNEAFLFFDGASKAPQLAEQFSRELSAPIEEGDVLLLRAFKADSSKFYVVTKATADAVESALHKLAGGDLTLKKAPFPAIHETE